MSKHMGCNRCRWADFDSGDDGATGALCWYGNGLVKPMPAARCEHYSMWSAEKPAEIIAPDDPNWT